MPRYKIVIAKRYKTLDALCDELIARKRTLRIDEIVDMVKDFSKQNEGIFDDIIISDDRNHNNKTFFDSRFPSHPHNKEFSGINYHSAANPRGVFPASLNQLCKFLRMAYTLRVGSQVLKEMKETTAAPKWRLVVSKNHSGFTKSADLRDWFKKEKWVDLRRPKKDGGYEPCGRGDTSKGKKPVCTPANKAKNIDKKERTQRLKEKAKKEKEPNPDKKPNVTKYSPGAGGKSKASDSHNIRFIGSMIPLSDLRPKQPKFIKISSIENEGGVEDPDFTMSRSKDPNNPFSDPNDLTLDNPDNPLDKMGYKERSGTEPSDPESADVFEDYFFKMYFPYYVQTIVNIILPMLEDSKYHFDYSKSSSFREFEKGLMDKEPDAIKIFLNANEYFANTNKSRGFSIVAQISCMHIALNAEKFIEHDINPFKIDKEQNPEAQQVWDMIKNGIFFEKKLNEEDN